MTSAAKYLNQRISATKRMKQCGIMDNVATGGGIAAKRVALAAFILKLGWLSLACGAG